MTPSEPFPTDFSATLNTLAFFAPDEIAIFDRLFIGGGLRWEDNSQFGSALTGRASAALVIKETGSKLRFAWGQGFRAPDHQRPLLPRLRQSRPSARAEHELGDRRRPAASGGTASAWGRPTSTRSSRDLIQFVFDPDHVSVSSRRTWGGRASRGWRRTPRSTPSTGSASTRTTRTWTPWISRPNQELGACRATAINTGVTVTPWSRLTLFMQANVVSSQLESAFAGRNPGYFRIDTGGTFVLLGQRGISNRLELTLRIQNLTNQNYTEVHGLPGAGHQRPGRAPRLLEVMSRHVASRRRSTRRSSHEVSTEAVVVRSRHPLTVLSSAIAGGGLATARSIVNLHVRKNWQPSPCGTASGWRAALDAYVARRALPTPYVGLATSAWTEHTEVASEREGDLAALVLVSVGLGNAVAAGLSARGPTDAPSTINTIAIVEAAASPAALVNLVITVTEVKAAVLRDAGLRCPGGHPATGTSTDAVVIAATDRGPRVRVRRADQRPGRPGRPRGPARARARGDRVAGATPVRRPPWLLSVPISALLHAAGLLAIVWLVSRAVSLPPLFVDLSAVVVDQERPSPAPGGERSGRRPESPGVAPGPPARRGAEPSAPGARQPGQRVRSASRARAAPGRQCLRCRDPVRRAAGPRRFAATWRQGIAPRDSRAAARRQGGVACRDGAATSRDASHRRTPRRIAMTALTLARRPGTRLVRREARLARRPNRRVPGAPARRRALEALPGRAHTSRRLDRAGPAIRRRDPAARARTREGRGARVGQPRDRPGAQMARRWWGVGVARGAPVLSTAPISRNGAGVSTTICSTPSRPGGAA